MRAIAVAASVAALLAGPTAAQAQTEAERELVRRHAPVMMLKVSPDPPCSRKGEQYAPSPVTITLGNPEVHLLRPRSRGGYEQTARLATAPSATDLAGLGPDYYLNLPGHPRRPGCTYARASARLLDGRPSVIYAHVAREAGVRGLAVQYWFYYWFNQFNDLHESDWEMIQVAFGRRRSSSRPTPPSSRATPGSRTAATGASTSPASPTGRPGRTPSASGWSRSAGWPASAPPRRRCPRATRSATRSPEHSAGRSARSRAS